MRLPVSPDEDALQTAACLQGLSRFSSTHVAPLASPPFGLTVHPGLLRRPLMWMHRSNIQITITVFMVCGWGHAHICQSLPINPQWVCSFTLLFKKAWLQWGSDWDAFAAEGEGRATARTHSVLPARADSVCLCVSKKGSSHDSLCCWNVALFMGYSLNVLSVDPLAARTKWLNITRSWRGWPEDRPLCSKLKATPVSFCRWCHGASCLSWCVSVVAAVDRAGCHMAECVNRGSEMMLVFCVFYSGNCRKPAESFTYFLLSPSRRKENYHI